MTQQAKISELRDCADLLLAEVEDNFETIEFFDLVEAWQDFLKMDAAERAIKLRKFAWHLVEDGLDNHDMRVMALIMSSDLKGENLVARFRDSFLVTGYTRHHIREYEQKGKASNVSWCA